MRWFRHGVLVLAGLVGIFASTGTLETRIYAVTQRVGFCLEQAIRAATERREPALAAYLTAGFPSRDGFAEGVAEAMGRKLLRPQA